MSVEGLEHYTKDALIEELINRQTFVGVVIFHRGEAKAERLEPGEVVMTKSPPLSHEGVEALLQLGQSLIPAMFAQEAESVVEQPADVLPLESAQLPLRLDDGGVVRIGSSRVSLDLVVEQYENGMTPEEMVRAYETLSLADVYAAIGYYVRHRDAVRGYLQRRREEAETLRTKIEEEHPPIARGDLLARRGASEKSHVATGQ